MTQFFANLLGTRVEPVSWARAREAEGWDGLGVADHLWVGGSHFPHWAVTLGQLAAVTERVTLLSCFANNLLRSPVEYAQAALTLQRASGGRFEAGLGAGWAQAEIASIGESFPSPGERVDRYLEALTVLRSLLHDRRCTFHGTHYDIDVPTLGPDVDVPPPIVVAAGGPRTLREAVPLGDRVELVFNAAATRGGQQHPQTLAELGRAHLDDLIDRAVATAPGVPRGIFLTIACGDDELVRELARPHALGITGLAGPPEVVAATVMELADGRIDRIQLTPATPASLELIAPHLPLGGVR